MILKQGHKYLPMPHDGKVIRRIYRGGRCYYIASPYSPEATQALKAAFPQYWTAIRDYGYAHPQLVPFINEDPMLIVSLVEVGKTRWLVGDGKAWIDTMVNPTTAIGAEMEFILGATQVVTNPSFYGSRSSNGFLLGNDSNGNLYVNITTQSLSGVKIEAGTSHKVWTQGTKFIDNGKEFACSAPTAVSYAIALFARRYQANEVERIAAMSVASFKLFEAEDKLHFIPMQHPTLGAGMLDIVSLTFHPNANTQGTFTIAITDKQ